MKNTTKILLINILIIIFSLNSFAQTDKEFWFCVPQLTSQHETDIPKLVITAFENDAKVNIDMPRQDAFIPITLNVPAGTSKIYQLSDYMSSNNQETNILESGLYGESCFVKDKGIHITSNELITVYLERGAGSNNDIWALKGKNAFGKEFIVPSQNDFRNHGWPHASDENSNSYKQDNPTAAKPQAWNNIDIVAIEDVTIIIEFPDKASDLVALWPGDGNPIPNTNNKGSFKLKRGQTLSIQAKSPAANKHLGGTIITANGYIAVQWKDDSLFKQQPSISGEGGCYDVIGDQLVPTKLAGTEYIIMRGKLGEGGSSYKKSEYIYIMAVKDGNTIVNFTPDDGSQLSSITLNGRGTQKHVRLNNGVLQLGDKKNYNALHISADKPVIVMHMAGFGCEVGGAILPTINGCTGSTDVSVCRSTSEGFFLNIMCKVAHKSDFTISVTYKDSNGNTKYRRKNDSNPSTECKDIAIPDSWFIDIPNSGWCYLSRDHMEFKDDANGLVRVKSGDVVKVSNSTGLFHLAIINGGTGTGCRYGYFSDFSNNMGKAVVAGDDFNSEYDRFCVGDTVTLSSTGGWKYQWSFITPDGVTIDNGTDDTFISTNTLTSEEMKSQREPKVKPIEGFNRYKVQIWRRCYLGTNVDTTINVWALGYPKITAEYIQDQTSPCSPSQVVLDNQTDEKGKMVNYVWRLEDGTNTIVKKGRDYGNDTLLNDGTSIIVQKGDKSDNAVLLVNNSTEVINYRLTLESSIEYNCPSTASKDFIVCPNVEASLLFKETNSNVQPEDKCQPLTVNFKSRLKGPFTKIIIDYGDGITPIKEISGTNPDLNNPNGYLYEFSHTYINPSIRDTVYHPSIRIVDELPGHGCESEASLSVRVVGYVKAQYVIDKSSACSPLTTTFKNNTIGLQDSMKYTWNYGTPSEGTPPADGSPLTPQTERFTLTYKNTGNSPIIYRNIGVKAIRIYDNGNNTYGTCDDSQNRDSLVIYPEFTVNYEVKPQDNNGYVRGCNPMTATFTNLSSDLSDKTQFTWYLGDGTSEKGSNEFTHEYSHALPDVQYYTTSLAGESQWGCRDSVSITTVAVMPYLNPNFTLDNASGCSPLTVKLKDNTPSHSDKTGLKWGIDDPTGSYTNTTFNSAIQNGEAELTFNNETGKVQTIKITLTDEWTDTGNDPQYTCSKSYEREIEIMPKIKAAITRNYETICDSSEVTFSNGTKFAGNNTVAPPTDYLWTFDDGTSTRTDNTNEVKHLYRNNSGEDGTNAKIFTASLIASANGCSDTATTTVGVYPKVRAAFGYEKATECVNSNGNVVATIINSSQSANKYEWKFGDVSNETPTTKTDKNNFNHDYASLNGNNKSTYTIELKAINSNNEACYDVTTKNIDIYPKVTAAFEPTNNAIGCSPLTTTFTNSSTGYDLNYKWEYDHDNLQSTESGATHTHTFDNVEAATHTYNVKLTVTDRNNCKSEITKTVNAYPHVVADFTYEKDAACTPYPVTFSYPVAALNGTQFVWDFGDGTATETKTNKQSFKHTFGNSDLNAPKTYNIKLVSTDLNTGCTDNVTKPIEVYPQLKPAFTQDVTEGCNPLPVQFTNQTTGGNIGYLWDFGDSQSSAETSPKHLFKHFKLTDQTYNVKLTTTQTATGCVKEVNQDIKVYSYVHAKFGINETNEGTNGITEILGGCTPFDVTITDSSKLSSAGTWLWDFGDGNTSTTRQPSSRTYTNDDNTYPLDNKPYTIKLVVTNEHGCWHDTAQTITVYPRSVPDFDANYEGCEPLTVNFVDNSIVDSKTQYFWTFSDGSTIVDKPPFPKVFHNYDYENDKKYTVNLKTTTQYNCTDEITKEITVYPKPLARFLPLIDRACPPFEAEFKNTSIGTGLTYYWDFDNGVKYPTTNTSNQKVRYTNDTDEPITRNVELIIESDHACRDTMVNPMITFPNVIVDFSFDTAGCSPHTIEIDNKSTKTTAYHLWDFGEGSTSVAAEPTFTYYNTTDNDQVLTITYIGTSKYQCSDTISKKVTVYINPNVDFVAHTPSQRYPDDTVYFENYTQDGPWSYNWEFGDGNKLKTDEKYFMYKYGQWGKNSENNIFHVTLHVETEHCENTMTHDVTILPPYPKIEILNQRPAGCVPLTVDFRIKEEYCNTYEWEFEDGTTSTEAEPSHTFTEPGIYNVKLTAEGDGGSHYDYEIITVYELPTPDFVATPTFVMLPNQPVQFFNSSLNGNTYIWDFGDGTYTSDLNPVHQYTKEGIYDVKLIAYSQQMCVDSIIKMQAIEVSGAGEIRFPNAFIATAASPADGSYPVPDDVKNVFHPIWHGVKDYDLWIFNRWGEQLFHSTDVNVGWNGKYGNDGKDLGQDVYFWKSKGTFQNGTPFKIAGDVTLIRK